MIKYRKISELPKTDLLNNCELFKEILYNVWLMETNFPDDENAFVAVLDNEQELIDMENFYQFLKGMGPEINEIYWNDDFVGYRKVIWVTGQDGSGIVALMEVRHGI